MNTVLTASAAPSRVEATPGNGRRRDSQSHDVGAPGASFADLLRDLEPNDRATVARTDHNAPEHRDPIDRRAHDPAAPDAERHGRDEVASGEPTHREADLDTDTETEQATAAVEDATAATDAVSPPREDGSFRLRLNSTSSDPTVAPEAMTAAGQPLQVTHAAAGAVAASSQDIVAPTAVAADPGTNVDVTSPAATGPIQTGPVLTDPVLTNPVLTNPVQTDLVLTSPRPSEAPAGALVPGPATQDPDGGDAPVTHADIATAMTTPGAPVATSGDQPAAEASVLSSSAAGETASSPTGEAAAGDASLADAGSTDPASPASPLLVASQDTSAADTVSARVATGVSGTTTRAVAPIEALSVPTAAPAGGAPVTTPPAAQLATAVAALRRRGEGEYTATLDLHPSELGRVQVQVEIRSGVVNLQVLAEQSATRVLLAQQLDDLRSALQQGGFQAGDLDVSSQSWNADQSDRQDGDGSPEDAPTMTPSPVAVLTAGGQPAAGAAGGLDLRL